MNQNIKFILEDLIKDDTLDIILFESKYTHSKNISEVEGNYIDWINISQITHTWFSIENENSKKEYKNPIIKLDSETIHYTPAIIKDYIDKFSKLN